MKHNKIDLSEMLSLQNKIMDQFFKNRRDSDAPHVCFLGYPHGVCENYSIISHVFSKSLLREYIAKNSQVYMPDGNVSTLRKTNGAISYKLVGVNKATTYYGFCQQHDNTVFSEIDSGSWLPTEKQIVLAYFRALCYELYQKYRASFNMRSLHGMLSNAADIHPNNATTIFRESASGNELSIHDNFPEFSELQKAIIEKKFPGHLYYASWSIKSRLPLACFSLINSIYDASGNKIQHSIRQNNRFENTLIAIVPTPSGSMMTVASLRSCSRSLQFIKSLLQSKSFQIADIVVKAVIANSENYCCSPIWYEKLPPRKKKIVLEQMQQIISLDAPYKLEPRIIEDMALLETTNIDF